MVVIDLCKTEAYRQLLRQPDDGFNHRRTHTVTQPGHPDRAVSLKKVKDRFISQLMHRQLKIYGDL